MRPVGYVKSAGKSCANWVKQEDGLWIISRYVCPAAACSSDDPMASCLLSSISWSSLHVSAMISPYQVLRHAVRNLAIVKASIICFCKSIQCAF